MNEKLERKIEDLNLSPRIKNLLYLEGIRTVKDLISYLDTCDSLFSYTKLRLNDVFIIKDVLESKETNKSSNILNYLFYKEKNENKKTYVEIAKKYHVSNNRVCKGILKYRYDKNISFSNFDPLMISTHSKLILMSNNMYMLNDIVKLNEDDLIGMKYSDDEFVNEMIEYIQEVKINE